MDNLKKIIMNVHIGRGDEPCYQFVMSFFVFKANG